MTDERRAALEAELLYLDAADAFVAAKAKGRGPAYDVAKAKLREARRAYRGYPKEVGPGDALANAEPIGLKTKTKRGN